MSDAYDPEFLADLEKEADFINTSGGSGRYAPRFQLKESGEEAIIRYVPHAFDSKGRWFARIARHWIGKRPYLCTRDTEEIHGGNGKCLVCDVLDELNRHKSKEVSTRAFSMFSVAQWLAYVLVYETTDARGRRTSPKDADAWKAHEFWHYKEAFADIMLLYKGYMRRAPEVRLSILDPEKGCDIFVQKAKRGYRFEKEPSQPLSKGDPFETMKLVAKSINFKIEKALSDRDLDDLLVKVEDICTRSGDRDDRRGGRDDRRGGRDDDRRSNSRDLDYDDDEPRSRRDDDELDSPHDGGRRRDDRGDSRSRRDDPPARPESRREDPPARPESRREDPPARSESRREEPRSESRRDESHEPQRREEPRREERREEPRSESRRDDAPARRRDDEPPPPITTRDNRRELPPPPAAGRTAAPAREDHEDDDLPSGDHDPVPPTSAKPDEVVAKPADPATPPATNKFQSSLSEGLRARIRKTSEGQP
jgi:hypothetical protein